MTTITAFAGVITMFARYKYVEKINDMIRKINPRLNVAALWIGWLSCLGMCFVATFQVTMEPVVHDIAAICFFVSGVIYLIVQSIISYKIHPYGSSMPVCHIRAAIATFSLLAAFPMIVCAALVKTLKMHWEIHDKQYELHVVSAVSEWMVAFGFVFFFFTYIREFKKFTLLLNVEIIN